MNDHASPPNPPDADPATAHPSAATCPAWCAGHPELYATDDGAFHHERVVGTLATNRDVTHDAVTIEVAVRLFEATPDDPHRGTYRPIVELIHVEHQTEILLLTGVDAGLLSRELAEAAQVAMPHPSWCLPALCTAVSATQGGSHLGMPHGHDASGWTVEVQPTAYPDHGEARDYGPAVTVLSVTNHEVPPRDDGEVFAPLDPEYVQAVVEALQAVAGLISTDDAERPLDPS